ncbi:transposase [Streptomyces sp. NPDC051362]|uniref:transposase n=1 Tax=Streptomyces sp. NPDC051362 TaxID=3365651 RepID=UPI0037AE555D
MALPDPRFTTPRVQGVDDFAIRRGQTSFTPLTCVEDHHVVHVLPTREAGPLAAWLIRHPGMEIICRGRAGAYAEGARPGAPDALQVADRFRLWQGLGQAREICVAAHRKCLCNPSPSSTLTEATRLAAGRPQDDSEPVGRPPGRHSRCRPATWPYRLRTPPAPGHRRRERRAHPGLELGQHRGRREPHQEDQEAGC